MICGAPFAEAGEYEVHPEQEGYEQDGEPLIDGYEIWSKLYESRESLADFYSSKYTRNDYHPPEWVIEAKARSAATNRDCEKGSA